MIEEEEKYHYEQSFYGKFHVNFLGEGSRKDICSEKKNLLIFLGDDSVGYVSVSLGVPLENNPNFLKGILRTNKNITRFGKKSETFEKKIFRKTLKSKQFCPQ